MRPTIENQFTFDCIAGTIKNIRKTLEIQGDILRTISIKGSKKKNRFLLHKQKDEMGRKAPTPTVPHEELIMTYCRNSQRE